MSTSVNHAICESELNERFGQPRPPHVVNKVKPRLDEWMTEFIGLSPFMVLATANVNGACDASPKGGPPGFVRVLDPETLLVPDYAGNNLFFGHRNILENPRVALLFFLPGEGWTVRVTGQAQLVNDAESERLAIKVTIEECFSHCPKALARSDLWNPAKHGRLPKV